MPGYIMEDGFKITNKLVIIMVGLPICGKVAFL